MNTSSTRWIPLLLVLLACAVYAQPYPNRPVRMVVGFAAGGSVDLVDEIFPLQHPGDRRVPLGERIPLAAVLQVVHIGQQNAQCGDQAANEHDRVERRAALDLDAEPGWVDRGRTVCVGL